MGLPPAGRVLVGLSLVLAWASLAKVLRVEGLPHPRGLAALVDLSVLVSPVAIGASSIVYAVALAAFVLGRRPDVAAAVLIGLLALGGHLQACQWPDGVGANGALTLPGAALSAWWLARRFGGTSGREAACGIVAAAYPLAALSKVTSSGLEWAGAGNLSLHIASQSYVGWSALQPLRLAAAGSPALCGALGVGTLIIEAGVIAFVWAPARLPLAALVAAMHVGIALLMGLHHYEWMLVVLGLALWRKGD
ncbi:MAG: hypothetical protein Q8P18_17490 [Pseudomonadota bacterium]|nr:hypothetical protein [Pseudomonadota bacterium]